MRDRAHDASVGISNKQKVESLLKSLETGAAEPSRYIDSRKYIQHNLQVGDGLAGLAELLQQIPPNSARVKTVRVFQDGDFVFSHSEYSLFGPKIGFDIFRFENGKMVEHWDNLQTTAGPNPSGHTMIDGATHIKDHVKTHANKTLIRTFLNEVLVRGKIDRLGVYLDENFIEHNPHVPDGIASLRKACAEWASKGAPVKFDTIHRILGEGNFVLAVSEGRRGDKRCSFYDLHRIENGKVVEHWDTIEEIPPRDRWKNSNGKF